MNPSDIKTIAQELGCSVNQVNKVVALVREDVIAELAKPFKPQSMWEATRQLERDAYAAGVASKKPEADTRLDDAPWAACRVIEITDPANQWCDVICLDLSTNELVRVDPWVGCALTHDQSLAVGDLVNFRYGPIHQGTYCPHEAKIVSAKSGMDAA
jgi:hypothetical protein